MAGRYFSVDEVIEKLMNEEDSSLEVSTDSESDSDSGDPQKATARPHVRVPMHMESDDEPDLLDEFLSLDDSHNELNIIEAEARRICSVAASSSAEVTTTEEDAGSVVMSRQRQLQE